MKQQFYQPFNADQQAQSIADALTDLGYLTSTNHIGTAGEQGFGVGLPTYIPSGFSALDGTYNRASANYGNFIHDSSGSIMVCIPKFYYKITAGTNTITIASTSDYASTTAANAAGFALPRAFIDGGDEKDYFFVDKYKCSNDGSGVAVSVALGNPISTYAAHNPISGITGCSGNYYYEAIRAPKSRGSDFFCNSRFIRSALAILALAHGQAATGTTHCAWYDAGGTTNFPKGCNDNALGDTNDGTISYTSDGYSNAAKTGSANYPARVAHNGQACGVMDLNGGMWEVEIGLTRPGTTYNENISDALGTAAFYVAKQSVAMKDFTEGWNDDVTYGVSANDHWGNPTHLATLFDTIDLAWCAATPTAQDFGNGSNQVLAEDTSGANWLMTGLFLPKDSAALSASGSNEFGQDYMYQNHQSNLSMISGGGWNAGSAAGVAAAALSYLRANSSDDVGFRAACYPV